jgi:hypothetical protein
MAREPAWRDALARKATERAPAMAWGAVADRMERLYRDALHRGL